MPKNAISFDLPIEDLMTLRTLAERQEKTLTQVLRDAICTETHFAEARLAGRTVLVADANGGWGEVVWSGYESEKGESTR